MALPTINVLEILRAVGWKIALAICGISLSFTLYVGLCVWVIGALVDFYEFFGFTGLFDSLKVSFDLGEITSDFFSIAAYSLAFDKFCEVWNMFLDVISGVGALFTGLFSSGVLVVVGLVFKRFTRAMAKDTLDIIGR